MKIEPWVDIKIKKPLEYELVQVETHHGNLKCGWWTGCGWDGLRLDASDKVVKWRRYVYYKTENAGTQDYRSQYV